MIISIEMIKNGLYYNLKNVLVSFTRFIDAIQREVFSF